MRIFWVILFFILFSFAPTFYEWGARTKIQPDRYFELVHNFPTDYNLYLSRVREGKEGAWLATEKYTSEPHSGSLSQILYVLIGRLADYSFVQTPYVWFAYQVARAFFAGLLLLVIWKVVEWVIPRSFQIITFLLIVTASTWPKFEWVAGFPRFGGYMPWYTMADSLQRTTFMPHVTLAQGLLAFIVLVFSGGFITKHLPGNWVFLGIVGLVLGVVFPPGLMFLYGVLVLVTVFDFFGKNMKKEAIFGRVIFGIMTMPAIVYYGLLLQKYPWKRLVEFDVLHPTKFSYIEYFMAVGPIFPLGIFGLIVLIKLGKLEKVKYFAAWVVAWLGFVLIFNWIPQQSPTRFTQMTPHIPLGILAALAIWEMGKKIGALRTIPIIVILFGFGTMASSFMWQKDFVDHKLRATLPIVPSGASVMYPMREIVDGLTWLQIYTPRSSVVLTAMTTGNSVPVYAGNTAYVGHANTVRLEEKLLATQEFYRGNGSVAWLKEQNIAYVFYGFEERDIHGSEIDLRNLYPELEQVYESPNVRIYRVVATP